MSQDQWHCVGYGIETSPAEISPERMLAFFNGHREAYYRKNPESMKSRIFNVGKVMDEYNKKGKIDNDFADRVRDCTTNYGYGEIIAAIMSEETGIRFASTGTSVDGAEAVIFDPRYIWDYSEKEKTMTEEDIENIFEKYGMELYGCIPKVDYIDLVYRG